VINVSLDDCTCACRNAEIINVAPLWQKIVLGIIVGLTFAGIGYLIYRIRQTHNEKKSKYIEIKMGK